MPRVDGLQDGVSRTGLGRWSVGLKSRRLGQASSRDSTRSGLFVGHDPARGSGHGVFKMSRVGSSRFRKFSNSYGMGRVGSRRFQISPVGSDRVKSFSNLMDRVGSGRVKRFLIVTGRVRWGQEATKIAQVGSGHDRSLASQAGMTFELFSANPRVGPADPAPGSDSRVQHLEHLPLYYPKVSLEPVFINTPLLSY